MGSSDWSLHVYDSASANRKKPSCDARFNLLRVFTTQPEERFLHRVLCPLPITPEHSASISQQRPLVAIYEGIDGVSRPGGS